MVDEFGAAACLARLRNLGTADPQRILKKDDFLQDTVAVVINRNGETPAQIEEGETVTT